MTFTFDQSKDEIARLVKHFTTNHAAFLAQGYKEAHARQEFIDPLFIALNWDVHNQQQAAPDYREVIVEDSLEMEGHEARKAPDYVFRIGRDRKFFAEAKKPGVDLKTAAGPAYQLRRYAWSAKLPLSVLTDFHEWAAYDCRIRPSEGDKTSTARLAYLNYEEYADRWHEIWDVFSREAVWGGSFDQYAQGGKGKRGTSEVDAEFLKEIESWRDSLARNIALRNPDLTLDEMNDAVQRTIDRIIFLRMVEARGMEEYGQLQKIADNDNIYANLLLLSIRADAKYNSGLFDFSKKGDQVTPRLTVDDKTLKPILADLYYPQSPYEFSVLPAEILGNVYEQFLGKVIHLTDAHHAKVEEKPEVKKAGGVYYTPSYIVEYIVKNTVGKQIEGKSPTQLKGFRVLDPACGSGSFLLGAYTFLLDSYRDWYSAHEPGKHKEAVTQQPDGSWQLTLPERKRILTEHIFGVDIDRQAVEVTKLSLLLKVLEGLKQLALFDERALPNLDNNIKCGNSLIDPDYFAGQMMPDIDELKRVNPFDWKQGFPEAIQAGGFDCVIGNPPYIRMETFKEIKDYLRVNYVCHNERSDIYAYMIERAHKVLKPGGLFGMIVSNKFLRANYGRPLREFIQQNASVNRIVDFAGLPVFKGATVRTIVFLSSHEKQKETLLYTPPLPMDVFATVETGLCAIETAVTQTTYIVSSAALARDIWSFAKQDAEYLLNRLKRETTPLTEYCNGLICMGVKSGLTDAFVIDSKTRARILKVNPKATEIIKPFLNGRDIRRYVLEPKGIYLIYTYHGVDISSYPAIENHLNQFKESLKKRVTKQKWYELQQPQYAYVKHFDSPKIVFPDIATAPRFVLDENGFYGSNTMYFIPGRDLFLLGLLNSKLAYFYFHTVCAGLEGKYETYLRFFGQYLEDYPIPKSTDKTQHGKMVSLVEQMLSLHKRKAEAKDTAEQERFQRVIDSTDQQIDTLVYELYGLTPEEIAIVEKAK
jgi:hypothetical protein